MEWNQVCSTMKDSDFLQWIYERMIYIHGENPNVDYMTRLKEIQKEVLRQEWWLWP